MITFPDIEIKIGYWVDKFVSFLADTFGSVFDFIFFVTSRSINFIDDVLMLIPWLLFILIIFALGWFFTGFWSGIMYGVFIFLIGSFGLWDDMMMTISIIVTAVVVSLVIGIPLGIYMSFSRVFSCMMRDRKITRLNSSQVANSYA